ncbi:lipopolysaccharide biosynthesis protein [Streptomyces sp. 6N223]|uniref:lipopolysaccharide biosynthesis protein n=1 Tax=Streptomyces sp. 6N223 TaxID=3457412 RepID=UPI003FCF6DE5
MASRIPPGRPPRSRVAGIPLPRLSWRPHLAAFASLTAAGQAESVLSFVTTATLIRIAGPAEAGQVFFAQSVATVWFLVWDPRMEDAMQHFVPAAQRGGPGRGTRLYHRLLRVDVATGAVATAVGVAAAITVTAAGLLPGDQGTFLVLAVLAAGMATPSGSASAGYALADRLSRLGRIRVALALAGCAVTLVAVLAAGPVGYLAAGAVSGLAATTLLTADACRHVRRACGVPRGGGGDGGHDARLPAGLVPFVVKSSATASVAVAAENGIALLAGLLGGPTLVTYLKVVAAPGRLLASVVNPVSAQLHPRLARARARGHGAAVTRDALRSSALTSAVGVAGVALAVPLSSPVLGLVYGPAYAALATPAVVLLAAAALRGVVVWAKVLPAAMGRPGVRLAFVTAEGLGSLGLLVAATRIWSGASAATAAFAWGLLCLVALSTVGWFAALRSLVRAMLPPSAPAEPSGDRSTADAAP